MYIPFRIVTYPPLPYNSCKLTPSIPLIPFLTVFLFHLGSLLSNAFDPPRRRSTISSFPRNPSYTLLFHHVFNVRSAFPQRFERANFERTHLLPHEPGQPRWVCCKIPSPTGAVLHIPICHIRSATCFPNTCRPNTRRFRFSPGQYLTRVRQYLMRYLCSLVCKSSFTYESYETSFARCFSVWGPLLASQTAQRIYFGSNYPNRPLRQKNFTLIFIKNNNNYFGPAKKMLPENHHDFSFLNEWILKIQNSPHKVMLLSTSKFLIYKNENSIVFSYKIWRTNCRWNAINKKNRNKNTSK